MEHSDEPTIEDVLKPGNEMVAAGYCMYGSSCMVLKMEIHKKKEISVTTSLISLFLVY